MVILGSRRVLQDLLDKCHSLKFNTALQWVWTVGKGVLVLQQIKKKKKWKSFPAFWHTHTWCHLCVHLESSLLQPFPLKILHQSIQIAACGFSWIPFFTGTAHAVCVPKDAFLQLSTRWLQSLYKKKLISKARGYQPTSQLCYQTEWLITPTPNIFAKSLDIIE